ncbi:MAG: hypothetical protein N4A53_01385 [Pelagimonas sp.]|nr:hypothetical protein [Pelagimonas sp.]
MATLDNKETYQSGSEEWTRSVFKNTTIHATSNNSTIGIKNFTEHNGVDNPNLWIDGNGRDNVTLDYSGTIHGIDLIYDASGHTRDGETYYWYADGGHDKGSGGPSSLDTWIRDIAVLDATSSADTIDLRALNNESRNFDMILADDGNDIVHGSDFADKIFGEDGDDTINGGDGNDFISGGKGNDSVNAGAGDDFVSMGAINSGEQEEVRLGTGKDTLSLGALAGTNAAETFDADQSFLTNLAEEGLNSALDVGMFALNSSGYGIGVQLGVVAAANIAKSGSGLFADWLGHNMANAESGDYDNDESSFVKLMDGNLAEDSILLPLLEFDTIETGEVIGNYTKTLKLDAENGGKFLEFTFDSGILSDVEANFDVSDTAISDFYNSLWQHYTHSIVTFAKDESGNVTIHTGTEIDGSENVASAADYGDAFDDLIAEVSGQLENGTQISVMGNAFGLNADMTNSSRFAVGTDNSDSFQMGERSDLNGEYMAMGLDGNDVFIIDQTNAFYLIDGGDGNDIINFSNMQEGSTGTVSQGVTIDLNAETLDLGYTGSYTNQVKNIENVVGTDLRDEIYGTDDANMLHGGGGNDEIKGEAGDDTIEGSNGDDVLRGQEGNDHVSGGDDNDQVHGGDGTDLLYGDAGNDLVKGGAGMDFALGGTGNDTVKGDGGEDQLTGGDGNDVLIGGADADLFRFFTEETGNDTITDFDLSEGDSITISTDGSDVNLSFAQSGSDVLISYDNDLGGTNTITVEDALLSDVQAGTTESAQTVICTHMNKHGYISDAVYKWDSYYGANMLGDTVIRGYHAWAIPFVTHVLEKSDLATRIVAPLAQGWALEMAHRCDPKAHPKGSVTGKTILALGVPLCRALGKILHKHSSAQAPV